MKSLAATMRRRRAKRTKVVEDAAAEAIGGRRLAASGAMPRGMRASVGGDLTHSRALIEHKRSETAMLRVELSWFKKVSAGARAMGKHPVVWICTEAEGHRGEGLFLPLTLVRAAGDPKTLVTRIEGIQTKAASIEFHGDLLARIERERSAVLLAFADDAPTCWFLVGKTVANLILNGDPDASLPAP